MDNLEELKKENLELFMKVKEYEIEISGLKLQLKALEKEKEQIENYKNKIQFLQERLIEKDTRNAGRKGLDDSIKDQVIKARNEGLTMKEISNRLNLALGTTHNIIMDDLKPKVLKDIKDGMSIENASDKYKISSKVINKLIGEKN
jgi:hypothetical protein